MSNRMVIPAQLDYSRYTAQDTYVVAKRAPRWLRWLLRLCLKREYLTEETYERFSIAGRTVESGKMLELIQEQIYALAGTFHTPRTVLIGTKTFAELYKLELRDRTFTTYTGAEVTAPDPFDGWRRRTTLFGLDVVVYPQMEGFVVLPYYLTEPERGTR